MERGLMALPILNGFSGTPTSTANIESIITATHKYHCNAYRISFNPPWYTGTGASRPYTPAYVDYLLLHSDFYVIVDRCHHLQTDTVDWAQLQEATFECLGRWGNNQRVIMEIVNEYVPSDFYARVQAVIDAVRQAGYTNYMLCDHFDTTQQKFNDTLYPVYQGRHPYFNTGTVSGKWYWIDNFFSMGVTDICNTEAGASSRESGDPSFNSTTIGLLNDWLALSKANNVGNMIWMNHDLNNLPKYESTAPYLQFDGGYTPATPVTLPYHNPLTALDNLSIINGTWSVG